MRRNLFLIFLGIIILFLFLIIPPPQMFGAGSWKVLGVISLMLLWWVTEAAPVAVTALLPIILFPVLQIMPIDDVTTNYGHPIIFLFFGGFVLALAMEKWSLHTRIALNIVRRTGTQANGIVFGVMLATAFLSMWLSNTATTVMMMPIAISIFSLVSRNRLRKELPKPVRSFALCLLLGLAFAANIGGTATLTGTPPNAILAGVIESKFGYQISYGQWMLIGIPFALLMLISCWFTLCFLIYPSKMGTIEGAGGAINQRFLQLGKISHNEIMVLIVFITTSLLWIFKGSLPFEISDAAIAIMSAVSLFLIPRSDKKGFIMSWRGYGAENDMMKMPWQILLLFGSGLSIASAMNETGLIQLIGNEIAAFSYLGVFVIVVICFCTALFITEVMSNLALITIFLPVLAGIAINIGENPLLLVIGATIASSCAFMLPMATPPNAVVFASGYVRIIDMMKAGILMNIISLILITLLSYTLVLWVFNIEIGILPDWAVL